MRFILQHVSGVREDIVKNMLNVVPDAKIVLCHGDPKETFRRSLIHEEHWHLEDDLIMPPDFIGQANRLLDKVGKNVLISGFSITKNSGFMRPSTYSWTQCFFMPTGYGTLLREFYENWDELKDYKSGYDIAIRKWLLSRKEKYWLECPSIVQHFSGKSLFGPRSSQRINKSWDANNRLVLT